MALLVLLVSITFTFGFALDRGIFEAWAKTASDATEDDLAGMYRRANFFERSFAVVGALLAGVLVWAAQVSKSQYPLMATCALAVGAELAYVWYLARAIPNEFPFRYGISLREQSKIAAAIRELSARAARECFSPSVLPVLVLLLMAYTAGQMIAYCWPALSGSLSAVREVSAPAVGSGASSPAANNAVAQFLFRFSPFIPAALQLFGFLGAWLARGKEFAGLPPMVIGKFGTLTLGVLFLCMAVSLPSRLQQGADPVLVPVTLAPLLLLLLARIVRFATLPFMDTIAQRAIGDEQIRATVISLRKAAANLVAALAFSMGAIFPSVKGLALAVGVVTICGALLVHEREL